MGGAKITHCGGVGTGGAVKICNNLLLAISMIGTSEAMILGIKLGLDPKLLASIMGSATGRCWSVDTYNPCPGVLDNVPSSNDYRGGFGTALMTNCEIDPGSWPVKLTQDFFSAKLIQDFDLL